MWAGSHNAWWDGTHLLLWSQNILNGSLSLAQGSVFTAAVSEPRSLQVISCCQKLRSVNFSDGGAQAAAGRVTVCIIDMTKARRVSAILTFLIFTLCSSLLCALTWYWCCHCLWMYPALFNISPMAFISFWRASLNHLLVNYTEPHLSAVIHGIVRVWGSQAGRAQLRIFQNICQTVQT